MASRNQAAPRLELTLPLSSASQKLVGNQLSISIFDSYLKDLKEEFFFAIAINKLSIVVCKPKK
jgi:hypothetical protein